MNSFCLLDFSSEQRAEKKLELTFFHFIYFMYTDRTNTVLVLETRNQFILIHLNNFLVPFFLYFHIIDYFLSSYNRLTTVFTMKVFVSVTNQQHFNSTTDWKGKK